MIYIFLCALLTACPLPILSAPVHQIPLGQSSVGEISNKFFEELEGLAEIVELCSHDSAKLRRDALLKNLDVVHQWDNADTQGYVAIDNDHRDIYVIFDGEYEYVDALVDLAFPLPFEAAGVYGSGGLIHGGFQKGWEAVGGAVLDRANLLRRDYGQHELNIVGRGAGGSVASLAALNFAMQGWEPKLTTFGQPRFGDAEFMEFFDEHVPPPRYRRVTHISDPVPILEFPELSLVHTNGEYLVHKLLPPYLPSDIRFCTLDSEDPICSAHVRTSPFDLPFTQGLYLTSKTAAPTGVDISLDLSIEFIESDIEFFLLPQELDFDLSLDLEPLPTAPTSSPFLPLLNPSPPNPNLHKRSLDKALEYFHLPKHQLEASLAEAKAAATCEACLAQDPGDPSCVPSDRENPDDGEDLISQASSVIIYNGRPVEVDGRPALLRRGPLSDKDHIGHCRKEGPGLGPILENTAPAHPASEAGVREEIVEVSEKPFEDEVVNVQGEQNFRVYNGIPMRGGVDTRYTDSVGGEAGRARPAPVEVEEENVEVVGVQGEAGGFLGRRGITYGWGEWEPCMQYLEGLSGPAIMSVAHEDGLDSGAWAGEAPNEIAKARFWWECDPRSVEGEAGVVWRGDANRRYREAGRGG